jgi:epoxyqueuosine reductase QueG
MSPHEWQTGARTVISLFFPMSDAVLESNRNATDHASDLWVYARIEGQAFINNYTYALCEWFKNQGYGACGPCIDPRFQSVSAGKGINDYPDINEKTFGSRWSERHAAYVCGLGTFGLSKGLITRRGIAGRFTSIIVTASLEADERPYTDVYEYCTRCGACTRRCPVQAIRIAAGKDHAICGQYLKRSEVIHSPRYGCGLCQTNVPCERRIPRKGY